MAEPTGRHGRQLQIFRETRHQSHGVGVVAADGHGKPSTIEFACVRPPQLGRAQVECLDHVCVRHVDGNALGDGLFGEHETRRTLWCRRVRRKRIGAIDERTTRERVCRGAMDVAPGLRRDGQQYRFTESYCLGNSSTVCAVSNCHGRRIGSVAVARADQDLVSGRRPAAAERTTHVSSSDDSDSHMNSLFGSIGTDAIEFDGHLEVRNKLGLMTTVVSVNAEQVEFAPYGDYESDCPARMGVDLFGNSWLPVIVYTLRDGPMRPGQLRTLIGGISQKMLTQTLRRMEQLTLIERRRYAEAPPRVEYALTEAGHDLLTPIYALGEWVDKHGRAVNAALTDPDDED